MDRLLIRGAMITDGTGAESFPGDVLVAEGRIAAVGGFAHPADCEAIEADGRYLTPGFVDIHRHADLQAFAPSFGQAELLQGITACVCGNCGMSAAPCPPDRAGELYSYLEPCLGKPPDGIGVPSFAGYVQRLGKQCLPIHVGALVGNGAVRIAVKGFDPSPMTAGEMNRARAYVAEAMQSGAMGLSMGLMYAPECNYSRDELTELAGVAGKHGGILAMHLRGEGGSLAPSVAEAIGIAAQAGVPLHISHFKAVGPGSRDRLNRAIGLIEQARAAGQDVTCDVYPYFAGATMLLTLLPPSLLADGVEPALAALGRPEVRERLRTELSAPGDGWDNLLPGLGWRRVVISSTSRPENSCLAGRSLQEAAQVRGVDEIDCLCDLLISERGRAGMILFSMSEEDVAQVISLPYSMIASDTIHPPTGLPHPRMYGSFPKVIRKYVRQTGLLSLPEAVRKMTALPAARMGLMHRGLIRQGYIADLLLFHPANVTDMVTYADPAQVAQGIDMVWLGGRAAVSHGTIQPQKHGCLIKREGTP